MKIRLWVLCLLLIPFLTCGIPQAQCESPESEIQNPKSEISKGEAVKLFADANENYLQAMKLLATKKHSGSRPASQRSDSAI